MKFRKPHQICQTRKLWINWKGLTVKLKVSSLAIGHAISVLLLSRSLMWLLLLGLYVFRQRIYELTRLVNYSSLLRFSAIYSEELTYQVSTIYRFQPRILSETDILLLMLKIMQTFMFTQLCMYVFKIITLKHAVLTDVVLANCRSKRNSQDFHKGPLKLSKTIKKQTCAKLYKNQSYLYF